MNSNKNAMNLNRWANGLPSLRCLWVFALLSAFLVSIGCGCAHASVWLVQNGQPRAEIVIAEQPARMTRLAANELQTYIEKISGAVLPIVTEPTAGAVRIYVGVSPHTEALGLDTEGLKYGAYRMASGPDWLALLGPDKDFEHPEPWARTFGDRFRAQAEWDKLTPDGNYFGFPYTRAYQNYNEELDIWLRDDGGTFNAVCDFLRDLGVRWYFPGELGEVVPELSDIPLPKLDHTARPDFDFRVPSYWVPDPETILWTLRLGGFAGQELHGTTQLCHGLKWMLMRDESKQAHPDWYALIDGNRAVGHTYSGAPCLTSAGLFAQTLAFKRWLYDERGEPMVNLDPPDGFGSMICQCEGCAGRATPERGLRGTASDYVFDFVNRAATELYRTHPERKVSALAYSSYTLPPQEIERLSPNLVLWMCQWRSNFHDPEVRSRELELRRDWLKTLSSGEIYIYDYYLHMVPRYGYEGLPAYFPHLIAEDIRSLKGISKGELFEVYLHRTPADFDWHPLAVMHLNIYVTLRLLWDADLDMEALLDEFYTRFYGPAAGPMKAFVEHAEAHWPHMRANLEAVEESLALLAVARAAAPPDSVYARRIALVAAYTANLTQLRDQLASGRKNEPGTGVRVLPVHALADKKLDGRLDNESYWPNVRTMPLRELETGDPSAKGLWSTVRIFRADDALYFGIHCGEPDVSNMAAGGEDIRQGDFVEILIETQTHSFYRITVGPGGALVDADCADGSIESRWTSGAEAVVHIGEDYWSAEIRVPIAGEGARIVDKLIGVEGRMPSDLFPWHINVGRQRVRDGQVERFSLAPSETREFDDVSEFVRMWSR